MFGWRRFLLASHKEECLSQVYDLTVFSQLLRPSRHWKASLVDFFLHLSSRLDDDGGQAVLDYAHPLW